MKLIDVIGHLKLYFDCEQILYDLDYAYANLDKLTQSYILVFYRNVILCFTCCT